MVVDPVGQQGEQDLGTVQRWDRDQVKDPQPYTEHRHIQEEIDGIGRHRPLRREVIDQGGHPQGSRGQKEVGRRAGQGGDGHVPLWVAEVPHIHWHRLGPAHPHSEQQHQADPVDMRDRVQRQTAVHLGGGVPQLVGREPVGQLVEGDAEQAGHRTDQQQKQLKPVHMLQKTIQRPHGGLPSLSMGHPWTNKYLFIIPDSQRKYKTANQAALFQKMLRRENFGNLQKAGG